MQFLTLSLLLSAIPLALAQAGYGDTGSPATTTSSTAPATTTTTSNSGVHTVTVGANSQLQFSPNNFNANPGDTVEFQFFGSQHSVAQGQFPSPCSPANGSAFFSGLISTTGSGPNANVWTVKINDTNPIYFYCTVPTHCESGMVGAINAPVGQSLASYQAAAMNVANTVAPTVVQGGVLGPAGSSSGSSSTSSSSSSASSSAPAKSAGVEARGGVQWTMLAATVVMAVGFGSLIL